MSASKRVYLTTKLDVEINFGHFFRLAMCFLSDNIYDYYNVSQGKITIPSMDDGEEFVATDVSRSLDLLQTPLKPLV